MVKPNAPLDHKSWRAYITLIMWRWDLWLISKLLYVKLLLLLKKVALIPI
jgi:hypothetical protein